jgi:uncharacterized protein DUF6491
MSERWPLYLLATLLLVRADADPAPNVDEILSNNGDAGDYAKTQRCLRSDAIEHTRILNDRYIVFETSRTERWLVKLDQPCPGLAPHATLEFDARPTGICEWNDLRVITSYGPGFPTRGPPCRLPAFQPVTQEQVDALREALKLGRDQH